MGGGSSRPSLKNCTLWKADRSPACRGVMMALDAMNIDVGEVDVNLDKGEHRSPEITALNPRQTLPILKDKDLILSDSNAIATYMAARYGSAAANMLLPTDPAGRALVEQFMHFNSSVLYPQYKAASNPILYQNSRVIAMPTFCEIHCAYYDMENMLKNRQWFNSGNWPSMGDIMLAATVSTLHILVPIQKRKYPKLASWLFRMSERNFYITANKNGLAEFAKRINIGVESHPILKEPKEIYKAPPPPAPERHQTKQLEDKGDNNDKAVVDIRKPVYNGERCCYLADLQDLHSTSPKAPRSPKPKKKPIEVLDLLKATRSPKPKKKPIESMDLLPKNAKE